MIESKKSLCTCIDHCRIGSLEIDNVDNAGTAIDHCRIGSLENKRQKMAYYINDHCRIGSLETKQTPPIKKKVRSLPHRQLRK